MSTARDDEALAAGFEVMLPNKKYTPFEIIDTLRKRALLIVGPAALGLFLALIASSKLPSVYQAESLLQIVPQRVPNNYVESTVTIQTENRLDALGQQVQSRTQLEQIITELNLYPLERASRPIQDVVEMMRLSIGMQPVRSTRNTPVDAFFLRFRYQDPVIAARVVERLSGLYIDYNARERGALADGASDFLKGQLTDAKTRLEAQERKLQAFRERNAGRLPTQAQYNMQAIQSTQLQRQALVESLARDRDSKLLNERLYADALAQPAAMSSRRPANESLAEMAPRQQLEVARANLAAAELKLKEGHPDLRRARKQVSDLEAQVAALPAADAGASLGGPTQEEVQRRERISGLRAAIESLDRQITFKESEERRLSGLINEYQGRLEAVPGVESEYLALTRENDTLQTAYRGLLEKSEAARVAAALENRQIGEQFRVLDPPRVPARPISPARPIISLGGLMGGLLLGLCLVVLLELRDGSLRTDADVEQVLKLPVVAIVPTLMTDADRRRIQSRRWLASVTGAVLIAAGGYVFWALRLWQFVA